MWLGGDPTTAHLAALAVNGVVAVGYVVYLRDLRRWKLWQVQALGFLGITTNATGFLHWGPFSAFAAVVPVSAYAFSSSTGLRSMIGPMSYAIASHVAVAVAMLRGWISIDVWVVPVPAMDQSHQIV